MFMILRKCKKMCFRMLHVILSSRQGDIHQIQGRYFRRYTIIHDEEYLLRIANLVLVYTF